MKAYAEHRSDVVRAIVLVLACIFLVVFGGPLVAHLLALWGLL